MEQCYTHEHLIQFYYQDTTIPEYFEMNDAMENDRMLKAEYRALRNTLRALPKVSFEPSSASIRNILRYSIQEPVKA